MSNELKTVRGNEPFPILSSELISWINDGHGEFRHFGRKPATDAMVAEAKRVMGAYDRAAKGPSVETVLAWLQVPALVVRNPPSAAVLGGIAKAFASVLVGIPATAFTADTARRAGQKFTFWPSAADVIELLKEEINAFHYAHYDLREICVTAYMTMEMVAVMNEENNKFDQEQRRRAKEIYAARGDETPPFSWRVPFDDFKGPPRTYYEPHAPVRTVEQQLAILRRDDAPTADEESEEPF